MDIKKIFGANIKRYRKNAGYTQMQLAELIEVDQKHVSFIENGNSFPSPALIGKIAEKLQIEPKALFDTAPFPTSEELKNDIINAVNYASKEELIKIHSFVCHIHLNKD